MSRPIAIIFTWYFRIPPSSVNFLPEHTQGKFSILFPENEGVMTNISTDISLINLVQTVLHAEYFYINREIMAYPVRQEIKY